MSKKTWTLIACLVLSLALGLGGSLAYLTDTSYRVNTFTMGGVSIELTEEFQQDAALKPGADITKKPIITNKSDTNAWVWLTWEIPSALDVYNAQGIEGADKNIIHWNFLAATCEKYLNNANYDTYLDNAKANGHLDEDITKEQIESNKSHWTLPVAIGTKTVGDIKYNVYVLKYNKTLEKNEATLPSIVNVYLDSRVDVAADGNKLYFVENGQPKEVWDNATNGRPQIIVNAYAIQEEGFDTVEEAYVAYNAQYPNGTQPDDETGNPADPDSAESETDDTTESNDTNTNPEGDETVSGEDSESAAQGNDVMPSDG